MSEPAVSTSLTIEQTDARAKGLGGSDAGVVCGLSPFKTPVALWQEKTGMVPRAQPAHDEIAEWGLLLENVIANEWARRTDHEVRRVRKTRVDREFPWMVANIDRDIVGLMEGLECKNASAWTADRWGPSGSDDVPLFYLTQAVHYMRVYDYRAWNFGVLLGGNELREYRIERDLEIENNLVALERRFWEGVEKREPPAPIAIADLVLLYPKTHGRIQATEEIAGLVARYAALKDEIKDRTKLCDDIKLEVGKFMGEHGDLISPFDAGATIATYRAHEEARIDSTRLRKEMPAVAESYSSKNIVRKFLSK